MTQIRPSRGAFSIMEMNGAKLQRVDHSPEFLRFKKELQERWSDRIFVVEDTESLDFCICVHEDNGSEHILFRTRLLNDETIQRIYKADQASDQYEDVIQKLEEGWAREEAEDDAMISNIAGEAAERLAVAFRKDGLLDHSNIYGPRTKSIPRAIRRGR